MDKRKRDKNYSFFKLIDCIADFLADFFQNCGIAVGKE